MAAGEAYGIVKGSKFNVHAERNDVQSPLIGEFVVRSTTNFTAKLALEESSPSAIIPPPIAYGLQTLTGPGKNLKLVVPNDLSNITDFVVDQPLGKFHNIRIEVLTPSTSTPPAKPDLTLAIKGKDTIIFEVHEPQCLDNGLTRVSEQVHYTPGTALTINDPVIVALSGAADFYAHLHHSPMSHALVGKVLLECIELEEGMVDDAWATKPTEPKKNLIGADGVLRLGDHDEDQFLGFEVVNNTEMPLYAALFYFDMGDLSISESSTRCSIEVYDCSDADSHIFTESYYTPGAAKDNNVDRCIRSKGRLTIGYGAGGGTPHVYHVRKGQDVDIGFLKLFVSTEWVDYSNIEQGPPFNGTRREEVKVVFRNSPWDTISIPMVQRRDA